MIGIYVFVFSFLTYSLHRYVDAFSTRLVSSKLNLEIHEVNPLVVFLTKRVSFERAMIITWFLFAIPIGLIDTLVYPLLRFPVACFFFGIFHLFAAANNFQIHFQVKAFGAENMERNTRDLIRSLKARSILGKLKYLAGLNLFYIFLAIYGLIALGLLFGLLSNVVVSFKEPTSFFLVYLPPIMIIDLIFFFPVIVFGSFIISYRRLKIFENEESSLEETARYVSLPTDVLKAALVEAERNGADYVQFFIADED